MVEQKSFLAAAVFSCMCAVKLLAGDVASFVDLGFSEDGNTYVFAQYGIEEETLFPWADLYIVNVPDNDFVPNGRFRYVHKEPIGPVQDGSGALMNIISKNAEFTKRYRADFLTKGVPLFLSLENGQNPAGETIEFRDFKNNISYRAELIPTLDYSGSEVRSSFYINVSRYDGQNTPRYFRVGTPSVKRSKISSYTIKKALVNPRNTSIIFVIEMTCEGRDGPDIRYMIEALKL
ncbi:MAG: DUF2259 domain-containing protein [Spirochaetaceae bacterium]|jgi:predicted secreted protein|nr:DUF2259 domain-containing protein [Spirochaetaceae bacterium]